MSIFDLFSKAIQSPKSYEEARNLSFEFIIQKDPSKARKVIKSIYKEDLPIKKADIPFIYEIACLASRPILRELEICRKLCEKITHVDNNHFGANSILLSL